MSVENKKEEFRDVVQMLAGQVKARYLHLTKAR
jgi:hypothetical protein